MKNFIKNFRINRIKKKILSFEVSRDSYTRWAEAYEKPKPCCGCNGTVVDVATSERNNANYCKLQIVFLKAKLKELIK